MTGRIATRLCVAALLVACACAGEGPASRAASSTTGASAGIDTQLPTLPPETQPPPVTTTTTEDEGPPVVLRGDGLGAVPFGKDVDQVLAALTLRWAPPNTDSRWMPAPGSPFGVCPGNEVRVVEWQGFRVYFSDGPTPFGPAGRRHFFTWVYLSEPGGNRPRLSTAEGVTIASSVADLQRAYGDRLELFDSEGGGGPSFGVQTENGGLFGFVTSVDPGGLVRSITGGGGCGE
jgi:hypothetical protein